MTKLKYTFIALITMLCALTLTSCMDLYDGDEVQTRFTVTFDDNGGSGEMKPVRFDYNEKIKLPANTFTNQYHKFEGWAKTSDGAVVYADKAEYTFTADTTLYAIWSELSITFDGNGGSYTDPSTSEVITQTKQYFESGESQTLTSNPFIHPEGKGFVGWGVKSDSKERKYSEGESISISESITLYALWGDYTVTLKANYDSTPAVADVTQYFMAGVAQAIMENPFTRAGYTIKGWAESSTGEQIYSATESITVTRNTELYAKWETTGQYTVSYAAGKAEGKEVSGVTVPETSYYAPDQTVTVQFIDQDVYDGYTFTGWSDGQTTYAWSSSEVTFTMPAHNVTLTAQWSPNVIDGGGFVMEVTKIEDLTGLFVEEKASVSGTTVTFKCKTDYTYKWLNEDGSEITVTEGIPTEDYTLYTWNASSATAGENCITIIAKDKGNYFSATVYVKITK